MKSRTPHSSWSNQRQGYSTSIHSSCDCFSILRLRRVRFNQRSHFSTDAGGRFGRRYLLPRFAVEFRREFNRHIDGLADPHGPVVDVPMILDGDIRFSGGKKSHHRTCKGEPPEST
jgi:hypothetical protein